MEDVRYTRIIDLKPNMELINITARVIETKPIKKIQTSKGERTLSEAVIGDETGRVKTILWGRHAGNVSEGDVIKINNAWTTIFKGELQLNIGSKSVIDKGNNDEAPEINSIPNQYPKAKNNYRPGTGVRGSKKSFRGGRFQINRER